MQNLITKIYPMQIFLHFAGHNLSTFEKASVHVTIKLLCTCSTCIINFFKFMLTELNYIL